MACSADDAVVVAAVEHGRCVEVWFRGVSSQARWRRFVVRAHVAGLGPGRLANRSAAVAMGGGSVVHDAEAAATRPGKCCIESYPCLHSTERCGVMDQASLSCPKRLVFTLKRF